MEYINGVIKILLTFAGIFCLLVLIANFLTQRFPRLPGDFDLRSPFPLYLPFTTAIVLTVVITIVSSYFFK